MSSQYALTIQVISGDPDGVLVVEKSNWSGRGVMFRRADLKAALDQSISSPGVYVLLGDDPKGEFDSQIYVGQGEEVRRRLDQHHSDDAKEFWTNTVVFVSKDSSLNRAHILHLEARLLGLADAAKLVRVANGNRPAAPSLSAIVQAEAEGFLSDMLAIFSVFNIEAFDEPKAPAKPKSPQRPEPTARPQMSARPKASASTSPRRYFLKGPDAAGEGEQRSSGFFVFAGATARIKETASMSSSNRQIRKKLLRAGVLKEEGDVYRLVEDHLFGSPSMAAVVLLSSNANGRNAWKDAYGVTLKEHQRAKQAGQ